MLEVLAAAAIICADIEVIDGDTIRCDGERMRLIGEGAPFVSGIDAPELFRAGCQTEYDIGVVAKDRLQELVNEGVTVEDAGAEDRYHRKLVRLRLPDGGFAETVLINEGLAKEWRPGKRVDWCE